MNSLLGTPICVVGAGRSGTSAIARALSSLGVYFGDESRLDVPLAHNLAGDWEHPFFSAMNAKVLDRLGCGVNVPPPLDLAPEWAGDAAFDDLRDEARAYVAEHFGGRRAWGWKSPSTTLVIPFWRAAVPDARYIVSLRNPRDMATSFRKMSGYSMRRCYAVCFQYSVFALRDTIDEQPLLVWFDDLINDPAGERARLIGFLGSSGPERPEAADPGSIRKDLANHMTPLDALFDDADAPAGIRQLYLGVFALSQLVRHGIVGGAEAKPLFAALLAMAQESWRGEAGGVAALWRRLAKAVPVGARAGRWFRSINHAVEVLQQGGPAEVLAAVARRRAGHAAPGADATAAGGGGRGR